MVYIDSVFIEYPDMPITVLSYAEAPLSFKSIDIEKQSEARSLSFFHSSRALPRGNSATQCKMTGVRKMTGEPLHMRVPITVRHEHVLTQRCTNKFIYLSRGGLTSQVDLWTTD